MPFIAAADPVLSQSCDWDYLRFAIAVVSPTILLYRLIYDIRKNATRFKINVFRDNSSIPALQRPNKTFILFKVVNLGTLPICINEFGFVLREKFDYVGCTDERISLVDIPWVVTIFKEDEPLTLSIKHTTLPGVIPPGSIGLAQIDFSSVRVAYDNILNRCDASPEGANFFGAMRALNAFEKMLRSYDDHKSTLEIRPYAATESGALRTGSNTTIHLGKLQDTMNPVLDRNGKPLTVLNPEGVKIYSP